MRKRKIILIILASVFCFVFVGLPGSSPIFSQEKAFPQDETEVLRREIRVLNLVNGLDLSLRQMGLIRGWAQEGQRLLHESRLFYDSRRPELDQVLEEIKRYRLENKDVPQELAQRFHSLDTELKKERARVQESLQSLTRDTEKCLQQHQLHALDSYIPCIIPPKGESRIGQAVDVKGISERLARLRNVPGRVYKMRKAQIVGNTLEQMKVRASPLFEEERTNEVAERLGDFYDRLRDLSDVDFEIEKESLAREFATLLKPQSRPLNLTQKIEAFLLAPEIIPILDARIEKVQSND